MEGGREGGRGGEMEVYNTVRVSHSFFILIHVYISKSQAQECHTRCIHLLGTVYTC